MMNTLFKKEEPLYEKQKADPKTHFRLRHGCDYGGHGGADERLRRS